MKELQNKKIHELEIWPLRFLIALICINEIGIPCVITALISPNCFLDAIYPPKTESTSYPTLSFDVYISHDELHPTLHALPVQTYQQSTYNPQFVYNYQCSSTMLTTYAFIFVYRYLISSLIKFGFVALIKYTQEHFYHKHGKENYYYELATSYLPLCVQPVLVDYSLLHANLLGSSENSSSIAVINPIVKSDTSSENNSNSSKATEENRDASLTNHIRNEALISFTKKSLIISTVCSLAVFLTFGVFT